MRKSKLIVFLVIMSMCFLVLMACGKPAETSQPANTSNNSSPEQKAAEEKPTVEPKTLKLITFLPIDHAFTKDMVPLWMQMIEEGTEGAVQVEWTGGPEAIPVTEQFDAVRNGIVDIGFNATAYYGNAIPEGFSTHLSAYTPTEERENGYFDYLAQRHELQGVHYLGRWVSASPFYFWSNKEISALAELNGKKFRSNPVYHELMVELGIAPIDIPPHEAYAALERNIADGFGFPLLGPRQSGWTEITKYLIKEPFLNQNATITINSEVFSSFPQDIQEKIKTISAEFEKEMYAYLEQENQKEMERLQEDGVNFIEYSAEDKALFQETVNRVMWERMAKTAPDQVEELKKILQ